MSVGEGEAGGEEEGEHQLDLDEEVISLDYLDEVCIHIKFKTRPSTFCVKY